MSETLEQPWHSDGAVLYIKMEIKFDHLNIVIMYAIHPIFQAAVA